MNFSTFLKSNSRWLSTGVFLTFLSCFGQTFFISIFAAEIMIDYDLTDGQWGRIYGFGTLASGLMMIWLGGFSDVMRVRSLSLYVHLAMCVFCLLMAFNSYVWALPFIIFGLRITGQGMSSHIAMVAMARWFTGARGKAIAIAALGFAIGEAFLPMTFAHLLTFIHWRLLWLIPIVVLLIMMPILRRMLSKERTPQSIPDNEQTVGIGGRHWRRNEVIKSWIFWAILPIYLMPNAFGTALFFQQVHLSNTKGWGHAEFVALFPLYTATAVLSSIGFGILIDRYGSTRLIKYILLPMAVSFVIFTYSDTLGHAAIAFLFLGIMAGGTQPTSTAFWSEAFGTKYIGSIKAFAAAMMVMASAIGPMLSGYLIDQGTPFHEQMLWIAGGVVLVSIVAAIAARAIIPKMPSLAR